MIHDGLIRHAIISSILRAREKIPLNFPPRRGGKKQGVEREQGKKGGKEGDGRHEGMDEASHCASYRY